MQTQELPEIPNKSKKNQIINATNIKVDTIKTESRKISEIKLEQKTLPNIQKENKN